MGQGSIVRVPGQPGTDGVHSRNGRHRGDPAGGGAGPKELDWAPVSRRLLATPEPARGSDPDDTTAKPCEKLLFIEVIRRWRENGFRPFKASNVEMARAIGWRGDARKLKPRVKHLLNGRRTKRYNPASGKREGESYKTPGAADAGRGWIILDGDGREDERTWEPGPALLKRLAVLKNDPAPCPTETEGCGETEGVCAPSPPSAGGGISDVARAPSPPGHVGAVPEPGGGRASAPRVGSDAAPPEAPPRSPLSLRGSESVGDQTLTSNGRRGSDPTLKTPEPPAEVPTAAAAGPEPTPEELKEVLDHHAGSSREIQASWYLGNLGSRLVRLKAETRDGQLILGYECNPGVALTAPDKKVIAWLKPELLALLKPKPVESPGAPTPTAPQVDPAAAKRIRDMIAGLGEGTDAGAAGDALAEAFRATDVDPDQSRGTYRRLAEAVEAGKLSRDVLMSAFEAACKKHVGGRPVENRGAVFIGAVRRLKGEALASAQGRDRVVNGGGS